MGRPEIPHGDVGRLQALFRKESLQQNKASFKLVTSSQAGKGVIRAQGAIGIAPWSPFLGVRWPRHCRSRTEDKILTGIQAQKKGSQISELSEGVGVGFWLLFGQAVGERSLWSSSDCSSGVGEVGE